MTSNNFKVKFMTLYKSFFNLGKKISSFMLLMLIVLTAQAQNFETIGTATTASASYGPFNRSTAASANNYSNYVYLYAASELNIPTGAIITRIDWEAAPGTGGMSGSNLFRIDMQNTTQASITVAAGNSWSTEVLNATKVFETSNYEVPEGGGWIQHYLDTGFVYTGNNLKILTDHFRGGTATGAITFRYETQTGMAGGTLGATTSRRTIDFSATYSNRRPNIRIYYILPGLDIAADVILGPNPPLPPASSTNVSARFINTAQDTIFSVDFAYQLNNQTPVVEPWTGVLVPGKFIDYNFNTPLSLPATGFPELMVWANDPNGAGTDDEPSNDTLKAAICMQLNGNYTIGPDPTDDFSTINEAVAKLSCGIAGPVQFLIKEGNYQERIVLGAVPNASATNTITLKGEKRSTTVIEHVTSVSAERAAITFTGAEHYILEDLTIDVSGGTYGWGIHLTSACNNIIIRNNEIISDITATSTNYNGIIASTSATSETGGGATASNLLIENNNIIGGSNGIRLNGSSSNQLQNIVIRNNRVFNSYSTGIYLLQVQAPVIEKNILDIRSGSGGSTSSEGIYFSTVPGPFVISQNKITNAGAMGIYITSSAATAANRSLIVNNMIGGGFRNTANTAGGIRILGTTNYIDIYYNSINMDIGAGSALNIRVTTVTNIRLMNNSFAYTGVDAGYAIYISSATVTSTVQDYNNYFSSGTKFVYYGAERANLALLRGVNTPAGLDQNSHDLNPVYASSTDLRTISPNLVGKGSPITGITLDYFGNARSATTPVIGAHEFKPVPFDAGITAITGPIVACPGSNAEQISVTLYNYGTQTLTSIPMRYQINGGSIISETLNATLNSNSASTYTFTTTANISGAGPFTLKVWTAVTGDTSFANDTVTAILTNGMFGTYTIGGSNPDYQNINDAVSDLVANGVCSAVTFEIRPGTYNERVVIPEILNASASNTITFRGLNRNTTILNHNTTVTGNRTAILLSGAKYVILDSFTIELPGTFGWGVQLTDGADNNTIRNLVINTSLTSTATNYAGIVASSSLTSATAGGNAAHNTLIENNIVNGGYYGVVMYGTAAFRLTGNVIRNNTFNEYHYYGVQLSNSAGTVVTGNKLYQRATGSEFGTAIRLESGPGPFNFSNNLIVGAGQYGMFINNSALAGSVRSLISNNMIGGNVKSTSNLAAGIRILNSSEIDVVYNSVNMDGQAGVALQLLNTATSINLLNNTFSFTGSGLGYAMQVDNPTSSLLRCDHNNYFSSGANFVLYGTALGDLAALQAVNSPAGNDANSLSVNPYFVAPTDLRISRIALLGKGTPFTGISTDIFGVARNNPPAIGAHEFIPLAVDAGVSALIAPVSSCGLGNSEVVSIEVINYGTSNLTSIPVSFRMNGGTVVTETLNTNIAINEVATFVFATPVTLNGPGPFNFEIWTSHNGDLLGTNDTIRVSVYKTLNGNFVIGGSNPDFNTLKEAFDLLAITGICGPTTFFLEPGVYNDKILIPNFPGHSSTNTFTLKGSGASSIINAPAGTVSAERAAIIIQGAEYVTIDSVTIHVAPTQTGTTYGTGIQIMSGSNHTVIKNNLIIADTLATSSGHNGIVISNDVTSTSSYPTVEDILIENNTFIGGYNGVSAYGNAGITRPTGYMRGLVIRNNEFKQTFYKAIAASYMYEPVFEGNSILMRTVATSQTTYGIDLYQCYGPFVIANNTIYNASAYGVFVWYASNPTATKSYIANNMIGGIFNATNTLSSALRIIGSASEPSQNIRVVHNSILYDGPSGVALQITSAGILNVDIQNNIFAYTGKRNGKVLNINAAAAVGITGMDHNNYYTNGTDIGTYNGVVVPTLADLRAIGVPVNNDSNSLNIIPPFISDQDLRVLAPDFYGKGMATPDVTSDIFGNPRSATAPTIGAHEFLPLDNDMALMAILSPSPYDCGDSVQRVTVVVKNLGLNVQVSIPIQVEIIGTVNDSYSELIPGPLAFGEVDTFNFVRGFNVQNGGNILVKVNTALVTDDNQNNDSASVNSIVNLRGEDPTVWNDTVCLNNAATLVANAPGGYRLWFDNASDNTPVAFGDTLRINNLLENTTYYVENIELGNTFHVGPVDTSIGVGSPALFNNTVIFTAHNNLVLDSVKLIVEVGGGVTIGLLDAQDNIIDRRTIAVNVNQSIYPLGFLLPAGVDYKLSILSSSGGAQLWRSTNGAVYPYVVPDLISITGTNYANPSDRYYFFYDLQVRPYCASSRMEVKAIVSELPEITSIKAGTIFQGTFNAGGSDNIDQSCAGDTLIYEFEAPLVYDNSHYGNEWSISNVSVSTLNGTLIGNQQFTSPTGSDNASLTIVSGVLDSDSTYLLSVTYNLATGCSVTLDRYIYISPKPIADFFVNPICLGDEATFLNQTTMVGSPALDFVWHFGDGNTSMQESPVHTYTLAGQYDVILVANAEIGCPDTIRKSVTVTTKPIADFTISNECNNQLTPIVNQSTSSTNAVYTWTMGDGNVVTATEPNYQYSGFGNFEVKLSINDNGCVDETTQSVTIFAAPKAGFLVNDVCLGTDALLGNTSEFANGNMTFLWEMGNGDTSSATSPVYTYSQAGNYAITLIASSTQCADTIVMPIEVFELPDASFIATNLNSGQVSFEASDLTLATYNWSFGDGIFGVGANITHTYSSNANFDVSLKTISTHGCMDSSSQSISVLNVSVNNIAGSDRISTYPNPFVESTQIHFTLNATNSVSLMVYDAAGKLVENLHQGSLEAGEHHWVFDKQVVPGVYMVRLVLDGQVYTEKIVKTK